MKTPELEQFRAFRHQVYPLFGCRRAALFELLDALLCAPSIETPAHLSLVPSCQRGWGSVYDALNAGTMDRPALERLVGAYPLTSGPAWYAVDASVWPRCDAETSPERGYYAHPYRHSHGQPIVAGWNYSWLVQVPHRCSSWTAPLRMRRVRPGENLNLVAAEQIHSWLRQAPPATPPGVSLPIFSFDSGYDSVQLASHSSNWACPSAVAGMGVLLSRTVPLGASKAQTTWADLATSMPTTQRISGDNIRATSSPHADGAGHAGSHLTSRARFPSPWALAARRTRGAQSFGHRPFTDGRQARESF